MVLNTCNILLEQVLSSHIPGHLEEKKVLRNSQHGLAEGKQCLTNLIALNDKMPRFVDRGKAVAVFYLDFSKSFNAVCRCVFVLQLGHYGLDRWTAR